MTPSPAIPADLRDSIPRMYHLTYLQAVLVAIGEGAPLDRIRSLVWDEARAVSRRVGPLASQPDDGYVHWSTTKDAIGECMKLGLVEKASVPSKRAQLDAHRDRTYDLTPDGERLVAEVQTGSAAFRQAIAPILIASHPYVAALLRYVGETPIVLRTYTEEELRAHKAASPLWVDRVAEEVATHTETCMSLPKTAQAVRQIAQGLRDGLNRRFSEVDAPRHKDVLDTVDDLVCALTLERLGLSIDAISFNVLMSWSRWLYVADESRYVLDLPGRVIWAAAYVTAVPPIAIGWRGVRDNGERIAKLLPQAYRDLAVAQGHPTDSAPLLPIYSVRATVAFRARVATPVVDRVLAQVADGERTVAYAVRLAVAGAATPPASEPPFVLGDRPYYLVSLYPQPKE